MIVLKALNSGVTQTLLSYRESNRPWEAKNQTRVWVSFLDSYLGRKRKQLFPPTSQIIINLGKLQALQSGFGRSEDARLQAPKGQVLFYLCIVKTNKQKPHLKWSWETRRENSHTCHSTHTTGPSKKRCTLHLWQEVTLLHYLRRTNRFLLAQPMGDCHNSANGKSLYFELPVSPTGVFLDSSPSQVHKRASSALFLWTSS